MKRSITVLATVLLLAWQAHAAPSANPAFLPLVVNPIIPSQTALPTQAPTATPTLPPPSFNNCEIDFDAPQAPNYPIQINRGYTTTLINKSNVTIDLTNWTVCYREIGRGPTQRYTLSGSIAPNGNQVFDFSTDTINLTIVEVRLYNANGQIVYYWRGVTSI